MALFAFVLWGYPRFNGAVSPTPETPTETLAPSTPTSSPAPSATSTPPPTEAVTLTVFVDPGIGGANKIALTANNEIYVMNIDGSAIEALTQTRLPKLDLQWLPGGSELLYVEGNCVNRIDVDTEQKEPQQFACFKDPRFAGFRVSPDGRWVAISIAYRMLVVPFDQTALSNATSTFELQKVENLCLDYAAVKDARWSADGKRLAIRYESVLGQRRGDTIRVIEVNWGRCQEVASLIWDEFPADRFAPEGYERFPILPSYDWDGDGRFLFKSFICNRNYGELYLYDMSAETARKGNPIDRVCCYGTAVFSPDGTHILFFSQDQRRGDKSENKLYYVPIDQIGTGTQLRPLRLPPLFFRDIRENIQLALHPALP